MARIFGTDGVRGVANKELTVELAMSLGKAGAFVFLRGGRFCLCTIKLSGMWLHIPDMFVSGSAGSADSGASSSHR